MQSQYGPTLNITHYNYDVAMQSGPLTRLGPEKCEAGVRFEVSDLFQKTVIYSNCHFNQPGHQPLVFKKLTNFLETSFFITGSKSSTAICRRDVSSSSVE